MEDAGSGSDEAAELPESSDEEGAPLSPQAEYYTFKREIIGEMKKSPNEEEKKEEKEEEEEEEEDRLTKLIELQKTLTLSVSNIRTAADTKELEQRREWEAARSIRMEQLENDARSSQEKCEEIMKGWSLFDQRLLPDEMRTALDSQKRLCAAILAEKEKLINDLQQELKKRNASYVKNLKKNAEQIDLMIERMEEQVKILNKAYTEELAETERAFLEEIEILLSDDRIKQEQDLKVHWDKELERLAKRRKTVEDYEVQLQSVMWRNIFEQSIPRQKQIAKLKVQQQETQQKLLEELLVRSQASEESGAAKFTQTKLYNMKRRITRWQDEIRKLKGEITGLEKGFRKRMLQLHSDHKRQVERYERLQKQAKHFESADARQFREVWQTIDEEVKQLVGKAVELDSLICRRYLGLAWKPPPMPFMEISGPIMSQEGAPGRQLVQSKSSQGGASSSAGSSPGTETGSAHVEASRGGTAARTESEMEVEEEEELSMEALQAVMELLCDETGFLIEDHLLKLLSPFEEDERPGLRHASLLCSLGLEDKDVPKLAVFLLKYRWQQRQQSQDVCGSKDAEAAEGSQLMDRNNVLLALRSFLQQHKKSRRSSQSMQSGFWHVQAYDAPKAKAYWESMANVLPEEKLKLLDVEEVTMRNYQAVLTDIDELVPETEKLKQQNAELRTLLHQRLSGAMDQAPGEVGFPQTGV